MKTETVWQENFKTIAAQARAWKQAQDARPISQTVNLLEEAYQSARSVANAGYDTARLARLLKEERYISDAEVQEIRAQIATFRSAIHDLEAGLNRALATLSNPDILEKSGN